MHTFLLANSHHPAFRDNEWLEPMAESFGKLLITLSQLWGLQSCDVGISSLFDPQGVVPSTWSSMDMAMGPRGKPRASTDWSDPPEGEDARQFLCISGRWEPHVSNMGALWKVLRTGASRQGIDHLSNTCPPCNASLLDVSWVQAASSWNCQVKSTSSNQLPGWPWLRTASWRCPWISSNIPTGWWMRSQPWVCDMWATTCPSSTSGPLWAPALKRSRGSWSWLKVSPKALRGPWALSLACWYGPSRRGQPLPLGAIRCIFHWSIWVHFTGFRWFGKGNWWYRDKGTKNHPIPVVPISMAGDEGHQPERQGTSSLGLELCSEGSTGWMGAHHLGAWNAVSSSFHRTCDDGWDLSIGFPRHMFYHFSICL